MTVLVEDMLIGMSSYRCESIGKNLQCKICIK